MVLVLLLVTLWWAGPWRAQLENARWIARHVVRKAQPRTRFGLPWIESCDAFVGAEHDMRAKLLGWLKVMHTDYADPMDVASMHSYLLLRYDSQVPPMPWALLPNAHVKWMAKDDTSAFLEIARPGLTGRYLVRFGGEGHISSMETDRPLSGFNLDYREVNGFRVPTRMDYKWREGDGRLISHCTFRVESVRHRVLDAFRQPPISERLLTLEAIGCPPLGSGRPWQRWKRATDLMPLR